MDELRMCMRSSMVDVSPYNGRVFLFTAYDVSSFSEAKAWCTVVDRDDLVAVLGWKEPLGVGVLEVAAPNFVTTSLIERVGNFMEECVASGWKGASRTPQPREQELAQAMSDAGVMQHVISQGVV